MLFSKIIKKKFDAVLGRYDGDPAQYYFSPKDFPALKTEAFDIKGDNNVNLKGFYYYYESINPDKFIVFDHGIGAGHMAYLNEINYLAKSGYTVYSYDHTGCVESEGTGILGFAQGINDLDHVLTAINQDPRFKDKPIKLMGHSWGGYSAMNVVALHPEVTHVVSLAGFLSARSLIEQYIPKLFLKYSEEVMERERQHNPKYADMNAIDSLKKSKAKLLHLQSTDDIKVKYELCTKLMLEDADLAKRDDIELVTVENKNHDPQRTVESNKATKAMLLELEESRNHGQLDDLEDIEEFKKRHDWTKIYEQDPKIWDKILEFLDK